MIPAFVFTLACVVPAADPIDWPALVQKPHADLPVPDIGLGPLLRTRDGEKITTRQGWEKARQGLREAWLKHLGPSPENPAKLDVHVEKREQLDGYSRQLLSFTCEGEDRIRAYLLVPGGLRPKERRPAVVVFHQTTSETLNEPVGLGKNQDLALALHLTRRGYVTLSPECYILKDCKGFSGAAQRAKKLADRRLGWTGMGKMTLDASRCVDFLESVPAVDKERIGCIGFSLGAKEVLYAMAFEPRYKVGVFNEGGIGLRMSNWTDAWYLTEKMRAHIPAAEHHQVLALAAPRPMLVMGGGSADGDNSWPFVKAALPVYELYGAGNRIGLYNHKGGHSFPREGRRIAYRWLDHWLGHTPL
jgi:dienelactone hydrolase